MLIHTRLRFLLVFVILLSAMPGCRGQVDEQKKNLVLMDLLKRSLEQGHFNPVQIDDEFSRRAFTLYLQQIDPFKRFFTQEDINGFKQYETLIDDEFKEYNTVFFDLTMGVLEKRMKAAEGWYREVLSKPFIFDNPEFFEMDPEKRDWPANEEDLRAAWEQMMKYETLTRLADMIDRQEKAKTRADSVFVAKSRDDMEKEAREKVEKRYSDWFHEMKKLERNDRFSDYLNALVSVYDPHTSFYPPKDKQDFDIQFSGQLEGIGATLQSKEGYVTIISIVPGGPAWKQGEIEVNDKIVKVAQGDAEPVDITDWRVDKAVQLIRGKKGTLVKLTVRKMDGTEKIIPIERDVVVIEETYTKSAVVEDTLTGSKVGYIYLPSFYANFDDPNGRSSSMDVRREVENLKKQGVSGIVLDLRGNGGGSLQDAIEIAGLFIDQGPIVQVKNRVGSPRVYGDPDPALVYDGPLVIMVNAVSASASEILAAAMQDHRRAVIVGTSQTFGKGTVQRFFNLDDLAQGFSEVKPLGSLKMTIQKFYRINGGATQLKGVSPDITMTDPYTYFEIGERELKYPMEWTEVEKARYTPLNNDRLFAGLRKKSVERMTADPRFKQLDENAKRMKDQRDRSRVPLRLADFTAQKKENEEKAKAFENIGKDTLSLRAFSLPGDLTQAGSDTTKLKIHHKWLNTLRTDNYLLESVRIVNDWNIGIARKD